MCRYYDYQAMGELEPSKLDNFRGDCCCFFIDLEEIVVCRIEMEMKAKWAHHCGI